MKSKGTKAKKEEKSDLYWLNASFKQKSQEDEKGWTQEPVDAETIDYEYTKSCEDIQPGNLAVVYKTGKWPTKSNGKKSLVAIFRYVEHLNGGWVKFEKVCNLEHPVALKWADRKRDDPIKHIKIQCGIFRLDNVQAELVKEMINASEGKDVFPCVASEGPSDLDSEKKSAESVAVVGVDGKTIEKERNRIVFGAPGTGKSFKIDHEACRHKGSDGKYVLGKFEDAEGEDCRYERVTFYPTYSYAQFVGTYKPVMRPVTKNCAKNEEDNVAEEKEEIAYEFVPGPFLRVLVNALKESLTTDGKKKGWCLIIEEINRANAAAVFGDVFQLLDRGSDGVSEYSVAASEDIKKYLRSELKGCEAAKRFLKVVDSVDTKGNAVWSSCSLRIPDNMYIWATMNSADQGVFPMDTAFKRRWEFEYIGVDEEAKGECLEWTVEGNGYNWDALRRCMNGILSANGVNEDKLMGPYFIRPASKATVIREEAFKSKVLMYIWEDAGRMIRRKLFGDTIKTYSQLINQWDQKGIRVVESAVKSAVESSAVSKEISDLYDKRAPSASKQDRQGEANTETDSGQA